MADKMSKQSRSYTMSRIRSKGNISTEIRFIRIMKSNGITGWRRNQKITGKPDFVFRIKKLALFIDGCFWHGCSKCNLIPKTNTDYWSKKIKYNKERDKLITSQLRKNGWHVLRFWEHNLDKPQTIVKRIKLILES